MQKNLPKELVTVPLAAFSGVDVGLDLGLDFGAVCFFDGAKCTQYNILILHKLRPIINLQLKCLMGGQ